MIKLFRTDPAIKQNVVVYYASWLAIAAMSKRYKAETKSCAEAIIQDMLANPH